VKKCLDSHLIKCLEIKNFNNNNKKANKNRKNRKNNKNNLIIKDFIKY